MVRPSIYKQEEMDQFIAHGYWDRANSLDIWERNADKYPHDEAVVDSQSRLTPLLHKDASESNGCSYKKAVSNLFGILSKGSFWIDPGDDIDFTVVPLWLRV